MSKTDFVPALCEDDDGNSFVYVGPDTFTRLPAGPERDRWMRKIEEGKVTIHEIAGCAVFDVTTGKSSLRLVDGWELDSDADQIEPQF